MRERLIGIDAGGTMPKGVLFDVAGNEIACERQPNVMLLPEQGWTERDADHMWAATCLSIRTLLDRTGTNPADIIAVTPSGYGGGVYLIDRDGAPVRNGLVSTDTRSVPLIEYWNETGLREQVSELIEQQVWPGQTLAILAWMQANEPGTLSRTAHVLPCKDFLRFRLCGDISTDPTDAGCAGILNVSRSEISSDVFKLTSLEGWLSKLPPVGSPTEIAGKVSDDVAAQTGLKAGTPVVRGVYDVVGCSLASGVQQASQLAAVAGTFSIHSTLHRKPALNPLPHIQTPYPVAGQILATTATRRLQAISNGSARLRCGQRLTRPVRRAAASMSSAMKWWQERFRVRAASSSFHFYTTGRAAHPPALPALPQAPQCLIC